MTSRDRSKGGKDEKPEPQHQKTVLRDYIETILICVIFVIFSRSFVFQQSKIPSGSMMDTLLSGDYIMVNRFIYSDQSFPWERYILPQRELRRGDVVVFKWPREPEVDYIKRVIGLPGDTIAVRQGILYRNGELIEEPFVQEEYRRANIKNYGPVTVKDGHYFMMGDHRNESSDSRVWGEVPRSLIKGRALLIWWSYDEQKSSAYMGFSERMKSWGDKFIHFFTRSRWGRCFTLIR
jgi:signal peptidase I